MAHSLPRGFRPTVELAVGASGKARAATATALRLTARWLDSLSMVGNRASDAVCGIIWRFRA